MSASTSPTTASACGGTDVTLLRDISQAATSALKFRAEGLASCLRMDLQMPQVKNCPAGRGRVGVTCDDDIKEVTLVAVRDATTALGIDGSPLHTCMC